MARIPSDPSYHRDVIRRATPADFGWVRSLAAESYRALGDYGSIIPAWLDHAGVLAYIDEIGQGDSRQRRGFILLGFYEPTGGTYVADLLAIAVSPKHQNAGVGRGLLRFAIDVARLAARENPVAEMRLTVADTNTVGRHLFDSAGFRVLDASHGAYDGGQTAIRMTIDL